MSKWLGSRTARREQLSQQERLIEQRKREIQLKLNDKLINNETNSQHKDNDHNEVTTDSNVATNTESNTNVSQNISIMNKNQTNEHKISVNESNDEKKISTNESNDEKKISTNESNDEMIDKIEVKPTANKFKNDGSFFAQFLQMQNQIQSQTTANSSNDPNLVSVKTEAKDSKQGIKMVLKAPQNAEDTSKLRIGSSSESSTVTFSDDEDDDSKVSPPEGKDIRLAIERTAISVTMNGVEAEETMRLSKQDNNLYGWLNDKSSSDYKYYEQRVEELKEAKKRAQNEGLLPVKSEKGAETSTSKGVKRQRKSRWSDEKETQNLMIKQDPALVQYAIQVFGNTDLSPNQWKQLEDQRKMKMLFEMLQKKQKEAERLARAGKVKYEYDSDEDIDDGTWEHKRRKEEMKKTQQWAEELTDKAHGKHHIGDFMPPEELEKFMQKWESVKEGKPMSSESDYKDAKLQSDNKGFQMLQKLGWVEGQGLGSTSTGIAEPINKSSGGFNNAGLGQTRAEELKEGDDEYEAYRKRMMMAYRFRPNPLNNPRRAYY